MKAKKCLITGIYCVLKFQLFFLNLYSKVPHNCMAAADSAVVLLELNVQLRTSLPSPPSNKKK